MAGAGTLLPQGNPGRAALIFITVGTGRQGFRRLVEGIDQLVGSGALAEGPVLMQIGHIAGFVPRFCEWQDFFGPEDFARWLREADVVVTHAGCGTLRQAIRLGKTPVVMPRLRRYGEHVNDHQLELLEAFSSAGLVVPALEKQDLPRAIAQARLRQRTTPGVREESPMIALVAKAIGELAGPRPHGWLARLRGT